MKKIVGVLTALLLFSSTAMNVYAAPYQNYTYDSDGIAQGEPQAYIPVETITGENLGIGSLNSPKDIFVYNDSTIYIADSGNNRIIVLDSQFALKNVITNFNNNGQLDSFQNPSGLFVDSHNNLYVADTGNQRVVALKADGSLYRVLGKPESPLLGDDFIYTPLKVAVDSAERVYIVSQNVNKGIVELSPNGDFWGFYGAVSTVPNFMLILQKMIATKAQREQMQLTVPTEYSSCDIDSSGFVYGTVSAVGNSTIDTKMFVHRLNPMGNDILKRNGFFDPMGDVNYQKDAVKGEIKPSQLCDVAVRDSEMYSVLDSRMGRVFTYNSNGDLMYVFGANGKSLGQFGVAEALDTIGDNYLIADSKYNWVNVFKPTDYGTLVTEAVRQYYNRNYEQADNLWQEIMNYTAKSDLAYKGVGLSLIKKGEYKQALTYLKLANDKKHYSTALWNYRAQVVDKYFAEIITGIVALPILIVLLKKVCRKRRHKGGKNG